MSDFILSCDSTADCSEEYFKSRDIKYACFHFFLDGVEYPDDLGKTVPFDKFYQAMSNGADTRTSQLNVDEFLEYFTPFLEEGKDIIHLTLSSGLSGVINSARVAAEELSDQYPGRKIYIVDSLAASAGYGLLMDKLADLRDEGKTIDEIRNFAENNKKKLNHWFFTTDLTFFIKGGRVSKTAGFIGNALNICPLLNVDYEGKLIPREKIRTKKKVIEETLKKMEELADNGLDYNGKVFISHSYCYDDARKLADLIEARFHKLAAPVQISSIGTTIGSHTGPGTVALFFWGELRYN